MLWHYSGSYRAFALRVYLLVYLCSVLILLRGCAIAVLASKSMLAALTIVVAVVVVVVFRCSRRPLTAVVSVVVPAVA